MQSDALLSLDQVLKTLMKKVRLKVKYSLENQHQPASTLTK